MIRDKWPRNLGRLIDEHFLLMHRLAEFVFCPLGLWQSVEC
jgi:hypothetical protein